jgi:hydrogenase-4 component B
VAPLALGGALLHVWNHALFKGLLFLASGNVGRAAGTLDLERLGGLLRRMPWTGAGLLVGAAAICALPPFNGFAGEFLVYAGSLRAIGQGPSGVAIALMSLGGLGLVGALAAAGFVRVTGIALLGEPRSPGAAAAAEAGRAMRLPLLGLAGGCLLLGIAGPVGLAAALRPLEQLLGPASDVRAALVPVVSALWRIGAVGGSVALASLLLVVARQRILRRRSARIAGTWDCGFAGPTPRMQYTASSFAQPLTRLCAPLLRIRTSGEVPSGPFPRPTSFASRSTDVTEGLFAGLFAGVAGVAMRLRPLQRGSTQLYVLYTALAALVLLLWGLV